MPQDKSKNITNVGCRPIKVAQAQTSDDDPVTLGHHPLPPHLFGEAFQATDGVTESGVSHRAISERMNKRGIAVSGIREMLIRHHVDPEKAKLRQDALKELGFEAEQQVFPFFPKNQLTRKGNFAEVVMAEYITATTNSFLPVYRLRFNTNWDQSMKGEDVLAFDLDSNPMRVIVGEAKFRGVSTAKAVKDAVNGLISSHKHKVPVLLPFVVNKLFDEKQQEQRDIAKKIIQCGGLISREELRPDYLALLLSDTKSAEKVNRKTPNSLRRLMMISLGVETPETFFDDCYRDLEEECLSQLI